MFTLKFCSIFFAVLTKMKFVLIIATPYTLWSIKL